MNTRHTLIGLGLVMVAAVIVSAGPVLALAAPTLAVLALGVFLAAANWGEGDDDRPARD